MSGLNRGELAHQVCKEWKRIDSIATMEKIHGYVVAWTVERWFREIPGDLRNHLVHTLFAYKLRNEHMLAHISSLAKVFADNKIPVLFLKGAAGLLKEMYPPEARSLADIDIVVQNGYMEQAVCLLYDSGYTRNEQNYVPPYHHHVSLLDHPSYRGQVELHFEPYDFSMLHRPVLPTLWKDAERIVRDGLEFLVPSATDHAWIMMRSHGYSKATLPRFYEAIEMQCIQQSGGSIDFEVLKYRSRRDMIPGLYDGILYTLDAFFDTRLPDSHYHRKISKAWIAWSDGRNRKKYGADYRVRGPEIRFAGLFFHNYDTVSGKLRLLKKFVQYESQYDRESYRWIRNNDRLLRLLRFLKDSLLLFYECCINARAVCSRAGETMKEKHLAQ
jgi:hypothetical protein